MRLTIALLLVVFAATARADSGPEVAVDVGSLPWALVAPGIGGPSVEASFGWRLGGHGFGLGVSGDHVFAPFFPSVGLLGYYRTPALYTSGRFALAARIEAVVLAPSGAGCMVPGDDAIEAPPPILQAGVDATWKMGALRAGLQLFESGFFECGRPMGGLPGVNLVVSYAPDWGAQSTAKSRSPGADGTWPFIELAAYGGFSVAPWSRGTSAPLTADAIPTSPVSAWMMTMDFGNDAWRGGVRLDFSTSASANEALNGMTGYAHAVAAIGRLPAGFRTEVELGLGIANQRLPLGNNLEPSGVASLRLVRPWGALRPALVLSEIVQGSGPFGPVRATPNPQISPRTTVLATVVSLSVGLSLGHSAG